MRPLTVVPAITRLLIPPTRAFHCVCLQAMSLMLPHASKIPGEDNTVEGRMANMSQAGYLPIARSSAELGEVLDKIKVGGVGWVGWLTECEGAACVAEASKCTSSDLLCLLRVNDDPPPKNSCCRTTCVASSAR